MTTPERQASIAVGDAGAQVLEAEKNWDNATAAYDKCLASRRCSQNINDGPAHYLNVAHADQIAVRNDMGDYYQADENLAAAYAPPTKSHSSLLDTALVVVGLTLGAAAVVSGIGAAAGIGLLGFDTATLGTISAVAGAVRGH